MAELRVFLVWEHPLLRDMIKAILEQAGLSLAGDAQGLEVLEEIQACQPDVVLVEDEDDLTEFLLSHMAELTSPRLIRLSLEDNKLHIYQREERLLTHPSDLVEAL